MSRFHPGDRVQFARVFMHKGMFVTPANPKKVEKVKEGQTGTLYDVVFLDAEGNPHVIENVREEELEETGGLRT